MREILGDISFREPEVSSFLSEYLTENKQTVDAAWKFKLRNGGSL